MEPGTSCLIPQGADVRPHTTAASRGVIPAAAGHPQTGGPRQGSRCPQASERPGQATPGLSWTRRSLPRPSGPIRLR